MPSGCRPCSCNRRSASRFSRVPQWRRSLRRSRTKRPLERQVSPHQQRQGDSKQSNRGISSAASLGTQVIGCLTTKSVGLGHLSRLSLTSLRSIAITRRFATRGLTPEMLLRLVAMGHGELVSFRQKSSASQCSKVHLFTPTMFLKGEGWSPVK